MTETEATPTRTQEVVDWLEGQGFNLCSKKDKHTRTGSGTQQDMTIDLTFTNETAFGQGLVCDHDMNPNLALLLDHHALTFKLRDPRETVNNLSEAKYNWKEAKEEDFIEALKQTLHEDDTTFNSMIQQVLNKDRTHATPDELDKAVKFINHCMEHMAEKAVPTHRMCS